MGFEHGAAPLRKNGRPCVRGGHGCRPGGARQGSSSARHGASQEMRTHLLQSGALGYNTPAMPLSEHTYAHTAGEGGADAPESTEGSAQQRGRAKACLQRYRQVSMGGRGHACLQRSAREGWEHPVVGGGASISPIYLCIRCFGRYPTGERHNPAVDAGHVASAVRTPQQSSPHPGHLQASSEILQLLQSLLRLGCPLEKGGLDEVFMDVTEMAVSSTLMYSCTPIYVDVRRPNGKLLHTVPV